MESLIQILDILAAIIVVVSLFYVQKYNKMWLFYVVGNALYAIIAYYRGLYGFLGLSAIMTGVAIKNYIVGRQTNGSKRSTR